MKKAPRAVIDFDTLPGASLLKANDSVCPSGELLRQCLRSPGWLLLQTGMEEGLRTAEKANNQTEDSHEVSAGRLTKPKQMVFVGLT